MDLLENFLATEPSSWQAWDELLVSFSCGKDDISKLASRVEHSRAFVDRLSWELFDKVIEIAGSHQEQGGKNMDGLYATVQLICRYTQPRELYMMALEKLSAPLQTSLAVSLILQIMYEALLNINGDEYTTNGLSLVVNAVMYAGSPPPYLTTTLTFAERLLVNNDRRQPGLLQNFDHIFVGFLLSMLSKCISSIVDLHVRQGFTDSVTVLLSRTEISFQEMFHFALRTRHRIFTYHTARNRLDKKNIMVEGLLSDKKESAKVMGYMEKVVLAAPSQALPSLAIDTSCWMTMIPWDMVSEKTLDLLAFKSGDGEINRDEEENEEEEEEDEKAVTRRNHVDALKALEAHPCFEGIPWSILGLSMVAHCYLCRSALLSLRPLILTNSFIWKMCCPFVSILLRQPNLATKEGLQMFEYLGMPLLRTSLFFLI